MAATAVAVAACGSTGGKSAAVLRPPSPVNLSVYISNARISVSPTSVGAGPVMFTVTNQANRAESIAVSSGARTVATTAPINPQGTTQVTVNTRPGTYTIQAAPHGGTDAQLTQNSPIAAASLRIGRARPSSSNQVLQP